MNEVEYPPRPPRPMIFGVIVIFIAGTVGAIGYALGKWHANPDEDSKTLYRDGPQIVRAIAVLEPTEGSSARGLVNFHSTEGGVRVYGRVENLSPGNHGFHIHEFGDLRKPDGSSAGDHFAPFGEKHGNRDAPESHVGDFGNIEANESGVANFDFVDQDLRFQGAGSILGRGVVVHADADDLISQPAGPAGKRLAVGVIGAAGQMEIAME